MKTLWLSATLLVCTASLQAAVFVYQLGLGGVREEAPAWAPMKVKTVVYLVVNPTAPSGKDNWVVRQDDGTWVAEETEFRHHIVFPAAGGVKWVLMKFEKQDTDEDKDGIGGVFTGQCSDYQGSSVGTPGSDWAVPKSLAGAMVSGTPGENYEAFTKVKGRLDLTWTNVANLSAWDTEDTALQIRAALLGGLPPPPPPPPPPTP